MIVAISYADDKYKIAQKFNSKCAKRWGAEAVVEYSDKDLSEEFKKDNEKLFQFSRGGGYWVWKPYIIKSALSNVDYGDFVVYTDAGSAFVNKIQFLIDAMNQEKTDIMVFSLTHLEKKYTKRDAFILMECDTPEIVNSPQICGTYIVVRKSAESIAFINQYLKYVQDIRIISDQENVMGKENYAGFVENRHDQSVLSLLCKREGVKPFRDPSEWGLNRAEFSEEINRISNYPQIIESHRNPNIRSIFQLKYKWWKTICTNPG